MKRCLSLIFLISALIALPLNAIQESFLRQFISPGDLVFDVGAHVGKKTIEYLNLGASVVCFEPQPVCIATLRGKFVNNPRVWIEEKGLADKPGILSLAICNVANTISTFSDEWQAKDGRFYSTGYRWNNHINVEVVTLDAMIARFGCPAFCKIDVENFEYEVLTGLTQPIPALSFEFAIEILHNTKKCLDHLVSLGYKKFNFAIAENECLALAEWVSAEQIIDAIEQTSRTYHLLWGDVYAKFD
jgi:FkbM family methyltransferase